MTRTCRSVATVNERVQGANARALHVLVPAPVKTGSTSTALAPVPAMSAVPVERQPPPGGYRRAVEAHRQAAPLSRGDPNIAAAAQRQTAVMRELSCWAFLEPPVVPDDAPAPIDQARIQRRRQAAVTEAATLRRARQERAGSVVPQAAALRTMA